MVFLLRHDVDELHETEVLAQSHLEMLQGGVVVG